MNHKIIAVYSVLRFASITFSNWLMQNRKQKWKCFCHDERLTNGIIEQNKKQNKTKKWNVTMKERRKKSSEMKLKCLCWKKAIFFCSLQIIEMVYPLLVCCYRFESCQLTRIFFVSKSMITKIYRKSERKMHANSARRIYNALKM